MVTENFGLLDSEIRRLVYDNFWNKGQPLSIIEVANVLNRPVSWVKESFHRQAQGHILVLQPESGEILMANPFSSVPTHFLAYAHRLAAEAGEADYEVVPDEIWLQAASSFNWHAYEPSETV